ncbi:gliding motility-associated peptidyl-prolyl isomerase GldI [Ascidiimonas sp. W6]|uniref:gliding motility-associated peptidyl-prolyl isomerase GldI n=1 Tax=Ascidiimonas meishanensis TaxID=3128903 RepID=UPI0030ECE743
MKKIGLLILISSLLIGCSDPEPRRPISIKSGSFNQKSVDRNIELLAAEEKLFSEIIEKDSTTNYLRSSNGYWYFYNIKQDSSAYQPMEDDLVKISYDIRSILNDTIYSNLDIGVTTIKVDKEELFPGLRTSIKLLREGETATFLFPSSMAYGYHGDNEKIGINVPLISTVKLIEVVERAKDSIIN